MEGGVGVAGEGLDDEHVFNDAVEAVGDAGEEAGGGADEPAKRASFVVAGVGLSLGGLILGVLVLVLGGGLGVRLGVGLVPCGLSLVLGLGGGWVLGLSGFWVGKNWGGEDV